MAEPSLVDRFFARLRANPLAAVLIIVGAIVVSLASFTDALAKLLKLLPARQGPVVSGTWHSAALSDEASQRAYTYVFELAAEGQALRGTALRAAPGCKGSQAPVCAGFGLPRGLLEGRVERDTLSFSVDWGEVAGAVPWTYRRLKQNFRGRLQGGELQLHVEEADGGAAFDVAATRPAASASASTSTAASTSAPAPR